MSKNNTSIKVINDHGPAGFIFFAAFIGAAVYFVQQSHGFWEFIAAIFKAMVWPGFVLYHILQLFHA